MDRAEAEAINDAGREVVVEVLLRMDEQIRRLEERVARQGERIAELERKLNRNSRNSSAPPKLRSAQQTQARQGSQRARARRPAGSRRARPRLAASLRRGEVIEHWPQRCSCGHVFQEHERRAVGDPARHQVEELPALTVNVIEHRAQRVRCPACGGQTRAKFPKDVAQSAFGPRLQAALAALSVRNRVSRRDVVELAEELFAARVSTGSIDAILARASEALAEPYEDLLGRVRSAQLC